MISLEQGVQLVWLAFEDMVGGEIYVKKIPSMHITDIASAIGPNSEQEVVGIRPGEKLHEQMIGIEDSPYTYEYDEYYKILPAINDWFKDANRISNGKLVLPEFTYSSNSNITWMSSDDLKEWIKKHENNIEKI
jgi:FlaA1/EpsC-like NDP-sugar epimerase